MAKFSVQIDVTFSGNIEIEANNEQHATVIAQKMNFLPSDIRNFWYLNSEVIDVEKLDEE